MSEERVAEAVEQRSEQVSIVKMNALADPTYCPYCMRCVGLHRMRKVETLYWKCARCGAEHDERDAAREGATNG